MKKILTISLLFLFSILHSTAQPDTVQLGIANSSLANPLYSPVFRLSATSATTHARSNILFTQLELQAVGLPIGASIVAVQFRKTVINSNIKTMYQGIFLANSSRTALGTPDTWESILNSHTKVYNNPIMQVPLDSGWATWNLSPFTYTGGALEMASEQEMIGSGGSNSYFSWRVDGTIPTNLIQGQVKTGAFPDTLNGTTANYLHRPNTRIIYTMGALPVKLTDFTAIRKGKEVQLDWMVTKEENLNSYEVERSADGRFFTTIGRLPAIGSNCYSLIDRQAPNSQLYYRLKIMEKDASFNYSKTVMVHAMQDGIMVEAFPNPFIDRVMLRVNTEKPAKLCLQVLAEDGRLLYNKEEIALPSGSSEIPLLLGHLPQGNYFIKALVDNTVKTIYLKR